MNRWQNGQEVNIYHGREESHVRAQAKGLYFSNLMRGRTLYLHHSAM